MPVCQKPISAEKKKKSPRGQMRAAMIRDHQLGHISDHVAQSVCLSLFSLLSIRSLYQIFPLLQTFSILIPERMRFYLRRGNRSLEPGPASTPQRNSPTLALCSLPSIPIRPVRSLPLPAAQEPHVTMYDFSYIYIQPPPL